MSTEPTLSPQEIHNLQKPLMKVKVTKEEACKMVARLRETYTVAQIAKMCCLSESTVRRDLRKVNNGNQG